MNMSVSTSSYNATLWDNSDFPFHSRPFYFVERDNLFPHISDAQLAVAAPFVVYWLVSGFFHILDSSSWGWLDKYRIHDSQEVKTRNRATRMEVLQAVLFQQVLQTALGLAWLEEGTALTFSMRRQSMLHIAQNVDWVLRLVMHENSVDVLLDSQGARVAYFLYWWGIPCVQLLFAIFWIDTWQYFLHRAMHINKTLYKHLHSVHHRLYVPYAFGALYNHPVEGFVLDSLGAVVAEWLCGLTTRQSALLFAIATMKTVDDHCGYSLPFDPLQLLTSNNADYHDIHHQIIGIKSNFSQPFFIHWDTILGTRMTRQDIEQRRTKLHQKAD